MVAGCRHTISLSFHGKFDFVWHFGHSFQGRFNSLGIQRRSSHSAQDSDSNRLFGLCLLSVDVQRAARKSAIASVARPRRDQKSLDRPQRDEYEQKLAHPYGHLFFHDWSPLLSGKYYEPSFFSIRLPTHGSGLHRPNHADQWNHRLNSHRSSPRQNSCIQETYPDLNTDIHGFVVSVVCQFAEGLEPRADLPLLGSIWLLACLDHAIRLGPRCRTYFHQVGACDRQWNDDVLRIGADSTSESDLLHDHGYRT